MKYAITILKSMLILYMGLAITGCAHRMLDFTAISSKNMQLQIAPNAKTSRAKGSNKAWWIISPLLASPDLKEAVDRAIESAGPDYDALIDGVIYRKTFYFFLVGSMAYEVVGTPINTSLLQANLQQDGSSGLASQSVLYHSSREISNDEALAKLKRIKVDN